MTDFIITHETKDLKHTTGYWSGQSISCNLTPGLVVLRQPLSSDAICHEITLLQEQIATTYFKSYFTKWIGKNYLGAFKPEAVLSEYGTSWSDLQKQLRAKKYNKGRISRFIAEKWWQSHKDNPTNGIATKKLDRIPSHLSPLVIDWESLESDRTNNFILKICKLSQFKTRPSQKSYSNFSRLTPLEKIRVFVAALSLEERSLIEWALPFLSSASDEKNYFHGARSAIHAAAIVLAWLRARSLLILPLNLENIYPWLTDFEVWPKRQLSSQEAKPVIKAGLLNFIASTTSSHIDDLPANLLHIYGTDQFRPGFYQSLSGWLNHPAIQRKRPIFPIDQLQASNLIKNQHVDKWSPAWVKENCNDEWYDFACLWWLHSATDNHKKNALRNLLEWAWDERSFDTPWNITPTDLRNPHRPSYKGTYFSFLKKKTIIDKAACWSTSATLYRVASQYAQMPDSPALVQGLIINPFESLPNPFSTARKKSNKTHRSSIPSSIHEMMIDILLSTDSDGTPTFSWAEQVSTDSHRDIVKVPDPANPKKEIEVWCPSRAACLAILMLTPLRSAQARWLDQGLMDDECYDFETKIMVRNQHSLSKFRYPNGKSQKQQYGRPSGILQFSSDAITREQALSIYVNTNKTQLWNKLRPSGYEVPWPDGKNLLESDEPEQREKGKWLARVYRVIEYQMNWMARYNPNPQPISFFHSHENRSRTTELAEVKDSLPWFVPLFRDLSVSKFVSYSLHGKRYGAYCPVSKSKINHLYNLLAAETEKRCNSKYKRKIYLTVPGKKNSQPRCRFDLHSLRVTWVSRLFEMGIPVHIISEFIVGHATQLMTTLYLKIQPAHVREALIQGMDKNDHFSGIEALLEKEKRGDHLQEYLIGSNRQEDLSGYLSDDFVAIVPVEGGICPMGGKGSMCAEGAITGLHGDQKPDKAKDGAQVQGGCGNCRFFLTGPDFLLEQLLACNCLMLRMRSLGKEQKQLYVRLDEIKWRLHELPSEKLVQRQSLEAQKRVLSERITAYNELTSPLILEWCNRHEMLLESSNLLQDMNNSNDRRLTLLGNQHLTVNDFRVAAQETTEFGLVRGLIEQARIVKRQGYPLPEEPSRLLREFMNIILAETSPQNLLLRIPDELYATQAASVLAGWLYDEFGDMTIQKCIDQRKPIPMTSLQNKQLQCFTERIIENYQDKKNPVSTLLPKSEPKRVNK